MDFSNETALLQQVYQGAVMGTDSIEQLLPKVDNPCFRSDLQTQYKEYQRVATEAEQQLKALSRCPKELDSKQRAMLWTSIQGQTLMNKETSHLAEMMIQGSNMGIINLTKVLNSYQSPSNSAAHTPETDKQKQARTLAQSTIEMEQHNINRLKSYLQ